MDGALPQPYQATGEPIPAVAEPSEKDGYFWLVAASFVIDGGLLVAAVVVGASLLLAPVASTLASASLLVAAALRALLGVALMMRWRRHSNGGCKHLGPDVAKLGQHQAATAWTIGSNAADSAERGQMCKEAAQEGAARAPEALVRQLLTMKAELEAAGCRERRLAEVARGRSARVIRLAAQLSRAAEQSSCFPPVSPGAAELKVTEPSAAWRSDAKHSSAERELGERELWLRPVEATEARVPFEATSFGAEYLDVNLGDPLVPLCKSPRCMAGRRWLFGLVGDNDCGLGWFPLECAVAPSDAADALSSLAATHAAAAAAEAEARASAPPVLAYGGGRCVFAGDGLCRGGVDLRSAVEGDFGGAFSVAFTAGWNHLAHRTCIVDFGCGSVADSIVVSNLGSADRSSLVFAIARGEDVRQVVAPEAIFCGEVHHYLCAVSASGRMRVYRDGHLLAERSEGDGGHAPRAVRRERLLVAGSRCSGDEPFCGLLSALHVWDIEVDCDGLPCAPEAASTSELLPAPEPPADAEAEQVQPQPQPQPRDEMVAKLARLAAESGSVRAKLKERMLGGHVVAASAFTSPAEAALAEVVEPQTCVAIPPEADDKLVPAARIVHSGGAGNANLQQEERRLLEGLSALASVTTSTSPPALVAQVNHAQAQTRDAGSPKDTSAAARLSRLAAGDASVQEAVRAKLRAAQAKRTAPLVAPAADSTPAAQPAEPAHPAAQVAAQSAAQPAERIALEMAEMAEMAAAYEELRAASRAREDALGAELWKARCEAATERDELRAASEIELGHCRAERDAFGQRAAEALEAFKRAARVARAAQASAAEARAAQASAAEASAAEASAAEAARARAAGASQASAAPRLPSSGPGVSLRWAEAPFWPGGAAPLLGVQRLRESLEGRDVELSVGPPPADWRTCLQLGLRRGSPACPAYLRLDVPGAEADTFLGLLWPADGMATM